jgi:HAD superfamily hydrolase (TIGR01509 family)
VGIHAAASPDDLEPGDDHAALLFDWDGTLADSQTVNYEVLRDALQARGAHLDRAWFDARTGVSSAEMATLVAKLSGVELDPVAVAADRDAAYLIRAQEVKEVPLVASVLRRHRHQRKVALATGGGRQTVTATAQALALLDLFDVVVTREDVDHGKPAPDLFLLAADRLGVPPARCLVYEDSDEGLAAATAAGMDAIDVRPLRLLDSVR